MVDPMSRVTEISSLFAALAANLQSQDPVARNKVEVSISDLNRTLNLNEVPRVRILDTALSLMCFTAPQVCDSMVEFTLKTIVTVLSSSFECKVSRINKEQVLSVGGTISKRDCADFMEVCADILRKLDGLKGDLCNSLVYAVIRLAALSPCFREVTPSSSNVRTNFNDSGISSVANLLVHGPLEVKFGNGEVPLRLLLWHLDPMILKQDISQIWQEIIKRPFLSFSMEIFDRPEWRSKLLCLVVSPLMFIETRALLHNWFLMTGLASVMELQIDLAQKVLDVISRPMCWGLSMEIGTKLPFSQAYFPHEHHLLKILTGPICHEYFQLLLNKVNGSDSHVGGHLCTFSKEAATKVNAVDHKSMWALVMNFPDWFFFTTMLLFCNNRTAESFLSGSIALSAKPYLIHGAEVSCSTAAANFIAWFLNPNDEFNRHLTVDYLVNVSELWTLKCSSSIQCNKETRMQRKETTVSILHDNDGITSQERNSRIIWSWLREFNNMYRKHFGMKFSSSTNTKELSIRQTLLFRQIPLGILLLLSNILSKGECSLLLHYAATGTIHKSLDKPNSGQSQKRQKYDGHGNLEMWIEQYTKCEAIAGCKTVFDIADVAESISPSTFETEEDSSDFIVQLKQKTCNYLLMCVKRLLKIKLDEDGVQMQKDLLTRVIRWRLQGKDAFPNNKDLDFICDALIV